MTESASQEMLGVSEALALAKRALESCTVRIIGEVSELSNKAGYKAVYFSVKDQKSSMPCMMWNNRYQESKVELRVGMLIEMTGRFSLYAAKGRMNFDVFSIAVAGEGDLRLKVANLAKKLQAEGLMDSSKKRHLPQYCTEIGLVTSPRGAAVHDVMRTLRRRFPLAHIILAGVPVEGVNAPAGIIEGISCVCNAGAEVVLVVRGGGSFEDLMPFNDEQLARAIAQCPVPVVTGIGHEPDTSIADMVADVRASTPTAAAETVSPSKEMLDEIISRRFFEMNNAVENILYQKRERLNRCLQKPLFSNAHELLAQEALHLDSISQRLPVAIPQKMLQRAHALQQAHTRLQAKLPYAMQMHSLRCDAYNNRLKQQAKKLLTPFQHDFALKASKLNDLSPLAILGRGYAMVQTPQGSIIPSAHSLREGDEIQVRMGDGGFEATITQLFELEDVLTKHKSTIKNMAHTPDDWKETLW